MKSLQYLYCNNYVCLTYSIYFVCVCLIPRPTLILANFWISEMYACMSSYTYVLNRLDQTPFHSLLTNQTLICSSSDYMPQHLLSYLNQIPSSYWQSQTSPVIEWSRSWSQIVIFVGSSYMFDNSTDYIWREFPHAYTSNLIKISHFYIKTTDCAHFT